MRRCLPVAALLLAAGCGKPPAVPPPPKITPYTEARPWAAVSYAPTGPPAYLGNGRLGVRLTPYGAGGDEKEPLPSYLLYQNALVEIPNPCQFEITVDHVLLGHSQPLYFKSWLDFKTGVYSVVWKELVGSNIVETKVETVCEPYVPVIAQVIQIRCPQGGAAANIWLGAKAGAAPSGTSSRFVLPFNPNLVSPNELPKEPPLSEIEQNVSAPPGVSAQQASDGFNYSCRIGSAWTTLERTSTINVGVEQQAVGGGFQGIALREEQFLDERWQTDIEIEGPVEDQQAIRSFLFYLYISATPKMPPMGLSSAKYHGHRFWDAEAYMLPVYAAIWPLAAKEATDWRLNVSERTARIPWEASATGADVTPPELADAIHVAGWVFWWLERAKTSGICDEARAGPIQEGIAASFVNASVKRNGKYEILGVISPDEGRKRNNDLVTNLLAKYAVGIEAALPDSQDRYIDFSENVKIPKAKDGLPATYDNDTIIRYQQAAALLALYPLEWPFPEAIAEKMFDRYKGKISSAGPAMSDCIHAVIACRLGRPDEAYQLWKASWEPFVRRETMQFCERRGSQDCYFVTGAAGCLQSVINGFLGVRMEKVKAGVSAKLFSVKAQLPAAWESVTFRGASLPGGRYTIRATHTTTNVEKGGP